MSVNMTAASLRLGSDGNYCPFVCLYVVVQNSDKKIPLGLNSRKINDYQIILY